MFLNRFPVNIFCLIFLAKTIYAMEELSWPNIDESKNAKSKTNAYVFENINESRKLLSLHEIAFKRVIQLLNSLTLEDEPEWILTQIPEDRQNELCKEIVKSNGAAWWYFFGSDAEIVDLSLFNPNWSESYNRRVCRYRTLISFDNNYILFFEDDELYSQESEVVIFNIVSLEFQYKGFYDAALDIVNEVDVKNVRTGEYLKINLEKLFPHFNYERRKFLHTRGIDISNTFMESGQMIFCHVQAKGFSINENDKYLEYYIPLVREDEKDINKYIDNVKKIIKSSVNKSAMIFEEFYTCKKPGFVAPYFCVRTHNKNFVAMIFKDFIDVWDLNSGRCLFKTQRDFDIFKISKCLCLSSDDSFISSVEKTVQMKDDKRLDDRDILSEKLCQKLVLINAKTGEQIFGFKTDEEIDSVATSPDNTKIAALLGLCANKKIRIWDIEPWLNNLSLKKLILIKVLYEEYQQKKYVQIRKDSIWYNILNSDDDFCKAIKKKFNVLTLR